MFLLQFRYKINFAKYERKIDRRHKLQNGLGVKTAPNFHKKLLHLKQQVPGVLGRQGRASQSSSYVRNLQDPGPRSSWGGGPAP